MGNCVSFHRNTDPATKFRVQIESPAKQNAIKINQPISELGFKPPSSPPEHVASFRDLSSKDNMFFDSQPWMESDCEDFFSVNGDLTPSRGNTPVHQNSFIATPQLDKVLYLENAPTSMQEPSPTDMKKQLIELFRESFSSDAVDSNQHLQTPLESKPTTIYQSPNSKNKSPYESVANSLCSGETTPYRGSNPRKEKSVQSVQCCLPNLVRSLSLSEKKQRQNSTNGGER